MRSGLCLACVQITAFCLISCVTVAMVEPLCSSFPTLRKWEQWPYRQVCRLKGKASHWAWSTFFLFCFDRTADHKAPEIHLSLHGPQGWVFRSVKDHAQLFTFKLRSSARLHCASLHVARCTLLPTEPSPQPGGMQEPCFQLQSWIPLLS